MDISQSATNTTVIATGGDAKSGSNADGAAGIRGNLTVHSGEVNATGGAGDGSGANGKGVNDGYNITIDAGVTYYEGDSANPSTNPSTTPPGPAGPITCTKRYVEIK